MSANLTLGRWIRDRARNTPGRVAIDYDGRLVTFAELDRDSDAWAAALRERGLRRGDRVATLTGNSPEHVAVFFACAKAALILAPLSWRLTGPELAYQLEDAEPPLPPHVQRAQHEVTHDRAGDANVDQHAEAHQHSDAPGRPAGAQEHERGVVAGLRMRRHGRRDRQRCGAAGRHHEPARSEREPGGDVAPVVRIGDDPRPAAQGKGEAGGGGGDRNRGATGVPDADRLSAGAEEQHARGRDREGRRRPAGARARRGGREHAGGRGEAGAAAAHRPMTV